MRGVNTGGLDQRTPAGTPSVYRMSVGKFGLLNCGLIIEYDSKIVKHYFAKMENGDIDRFRPSQTYIHSTF